MFFAKRLADEDVVYTAISNLFCSFVEQLSFYLCFHRKHDPKAFENTIALYLIWKSRISLAEMKDQRVLMDIARRDLHKTILSEKAASRGIDYIGK